MVIRTRLVAWIMAMACGGEMAFAAAEGLVGRLMMVRVPVASLWTTSRPPVPPYPQEPLQELLPSFLFRPGTPEYDEAERVAMPHSTQLLEGDPVRIISEENDMYHVEVPYQLHFYRQDGAIEGSWGPICGWVAKKYLMGADLGSIYRSYGTPGEYVRKTGGDEMRLRRALVDYVVGFLGDPYCWGGVSKYDKNNKGVPTSVDCSGLVYLAFRNVLHSLKNSAVNYGLVVPRNSGSQWLAATTIKREELLPGDLIFSRRRKEDGGRIEHVLMYLGFNKDGEEELVEAEGRDTRSVRIIKVAEACKRFGAAWESLNEGTVIFAGDPERERKLHFSTFFPPPGSKETKVAADFRAHYGY